MRIDCQVRCVADVGAVLGEGPAWVEREQALYWVDIKGRKIFRLGESGEVRQWDTPIRVGSLVPRQSGGFIGGTEDGIAAIDLEAGRFQILLHPEIDQPENRFNDGKVDRHARFWAGTMHDPETEAAGALYLLDHELGCTRADDGYKVTNGPAFSPDGRTMYHNDSARQVTYAFDLDRDGMASNRRVFARYSDGDGYPDGMTVDSEGGLWIAFWDGWCVRRYSPGGECLAKVELPVQKPTSCAFGGPDLDRLYVTSASIGLDEAERARQAQAGGLFMLGPGVKGLPEMPFAG
ncbi:MAG TPA: SMP-30/gluconolactonase/LRE family protein [Sphingomicrobium sp.]|jgi:xylono-1,5-lactonase|nr:SMP-30/gluconolactonase/LRE family protein [Sphingomicrobium sp.]